RVVICRTACVDSIEKVLRNDNGEVVVRVELGGQEVGGRQVPRFAVASRQRPVGDLANDRLHEAVLAAVGREPVLLQGDDLLALQGSQRVIELIAVRAERQQAFARKGRAQDARISNHGTLGRRQRIQPSRDKSL